MFSPDLTTKPDAGIQERRNHSHADGRILGRVIACDGATAVLSASLEGQSNNMGVGRLVSIAVGDNRIVALARSMRCDLPSWHEEGTNTYHVELELMGEVRRQPDGREHFSSGISAYPPLGAVAHQIRSADLVRIYEQKGTGNCIVGRLSQDESIDATVDMSAMLSRHFAVVGSTGTGKSTAVSLLLREAIRSDQKLRILILDPHNEFAAAFPETSVVIDTGLLDLPFWLFRLEEFAEVLYRGRPAIPDELDVLRDLIPEAKRAFRGPDATNGRRLTERNGLTADTPVPYRLADLLALIDERIGRLEGRNEKPYLRALKLRLSAAINDPRYRFMFSSNTISDTINETIAQIFRIPGGNRPISVFQLAGIPSEVVNSVASVLCRMAFEIVLWSKGAVRLLVVCEEAHRYVPADPELGFFPTRQALARIAKEGRKYGVSLGIITQRPGELDQTILSQCSTVFSFRLANERDQDIIKRALPNSSISALSFISSLSNGEAIAFGEAVPVPMRLKFNRVVEEFLPAAHGSETVDSELDPNTINLSTVIERMRSTIGPDISDFQSRVTAVENSIVQAVTSTNPGQKSSSPISSVRPPTIDSSDLEPYRPDMLPGQFAAVGEQDGKHDTAFDRYGLLLDRQHGYGRTDRTEISSAQAALKASRRESLLKKPLESLIRRQDRE